MKIASPEPSALRARALSYLGAVIPDPQVNLQFHIEALGIFEEIGDLRGMVGQWGALGTQRTFVGDDHAAAEYFERSLDACRKLGEQAEIAGAASNLAVVVRRLGEFSRARALLEEAMAIFEAIDDPSGVAWTFNRLGDVHRRAGNLSDAVQSYSKARAGFIEIGDRWGLARTSLDSGHLALREGDIGLARMKFREALGSYLDLAHRRGVTMTLVGFAWLAIAEDRPECALTLAGAADSARRSVGTTIRLHEKAKLDRLLRSPSLKRIDEMTAEAMWHRGTRMTLEEAIHLALEPDAADDGEIPRPRTSAPKRSTGS